MVINYSFININDLNKFIKKKLSWKVFYKIFLFRYHYIITVLIDVVKALVTQGALYALYTLSPAKATFYLFIFYFSSSTSFKCYFIY